MFGPVLSGDKVTLRPPRKDEIDLYRTWFEDLEVTRYILRRTVPSEEEEADWLKRVGEERNSVVWAIEVDGKAIGSTGIHSIDWQHGHAITGILIGDKSLWRQGIATEVMALRTRFAFRELNLHKLKTRAFMANEGSKRALMKTGYKQSGVEREEMFREGHWHDMWVGEMLREDWEKAHPEK